MKTLLYSVYDGLKYYICRHCWYKTHPYISALNFLNIQPIFNPQKVLEDWDWGLFNHTIKYYICRYCQYKLWYAIQNIIHSMLCMSTLWIQLKSADSELSKTSNGLKIDWISRKLWAKMCWQCQYCWYFWKALILSFPKLFSDWKSVEY